jgi:hypothetical protein
MTSLIYSRPANGRFLSRDEVFTLAPAALSNTVSDTLSGIYGQLGTYDAINALADYGYQPVQAAQKQSRTLSAMAHGEHLISFAKEGSNAVEIDGHRGEIILYNSHDGTSSLKLFAGSYRFICSNGIVAGDGFEARIRHTKSTIDGFEEMLKDTASKLPALMGRIQDLQQQQLDEQQVLQFAQNAATLRWEWDEASDEFRKGAYADNMTVRGLLRTKRNADAGMSAWNVYNRCQEALVRGGPMITSYTDKTGPRGRYRRSRAIGSVKATTEINRKLWDSLEAITEDA